MNPIVMVASRRRGGGVVSSGSGDAPAFPLIDYAGTSAGSGQFTLAWFAPTLMGDGATAVVGTPSYKMYFGTTRGEVEKGPLGSGTTVRTKSAGVLLHNETSLGAGTYYAVVTAVLNDQESYESFTQTFVVT